jgi:hypothetical protein
MNLMVTSLSHETMDDKNKYETFTQQEIRRILSQVLADQMLFDFICWLMIFVLVNRTSTTDYR